jgi:hypothetical protein
LTPTTTQTAEGKVLRLLNVIDEFTREAPEMLVERSIGVDAPVSVLEPLVAEREAPEYLAVAERLDVLEGGGLQLEPCSSKASASEPAPVTARMLILLPQPRPGLWWERALVGELLLDSSEVDPGAFSADQAATEIENVQKTRLDWPPATPEPEGPTNGGCVQDRLVDDVVVPVPASDGLEAVDSQIGEQGSIEPLDLVAAMKWLAGPSDDVVFGVGAEPLDDRLQVASFFGPVMAVHEGVHLLAGRALCRLLLRGHRLFSFGVRCWSRISSARRACWSAVGLRRRFTAPRKAPEDSLESHEEVPTVIPDM